MTGCSIVLKLGRSVRRPLPDYRAHARLVPHRLDAHPSGRFGVVGSAQHVETALRLAAARCELLNDVPGCFSADPNRDAGAEQLPAVGSSRALDMARAGCDLVQEAALECARRAGLVLVIRSAHDARHTFLSEDRHAVRHENDSRRAAVGA